MLSEFKPPRMETITATAKLFNLPVYFVRTKVLSGEAIAVKAGRKHLVNIERFAEYLNSNRVEQPKQAASSIRPIGR